MFGKRVFCKGALNAYRSRMNHQHVTSEACLNSFLLLMPKSQVSMTQFH